MNVRDCVAGFIILFLIMCVGCGARRHTVDQYRNTARCKHRALQYKLKICSQGQILSARGVCAKFREHNMFPYVHNPNEIVGTGVLDRPLTQQNLRTVREAGPYTHKCNCAKTSLQTTPFPCPCKGTFLFIKTLNLCYTPLIFKCDYFLRKKYLPIGNIFNFFMKNNTKMICKRL